MSSPAEAKLRDLKGAGYTAVITLLHPAVIPFEPRLLATETEAAERAGIPLIHLPMLPWVSDNAEALLAVRRLAESGEGRFYMHCYLGVDRVNVVRRVVENVRGIDTVDGAESARGPRLEDLTGNEGFERGAVIELAEGVFVTPYPTGEEWNSFIIGGRIRTVISLLDPAHESDRRWIARERLLLESVGMTFVHSPVPSSGSNRAAALAAVAAVRAAEKPVIVHGFLIPSHPVEAFMQAFKGSAQ